MGEPTSRVAVIGNGGPACRVRRAIEEVGAQLVDRATANAIVAVGDDAIRDALVGESESSARSSDRPVVPLRSGTGSAGTGHVTDRIRGLLDGTDRRVPYPVLAVETDGEIVDRAAFDVAFVTDEPARISEYAVEIDSNRCESFRADGVAIATPLGSEGYANAAGGPVITPDGGLAVVPIAPFTTRSDTWVVPEGVTLSVERESEAVSLVVDGSRRDIVVPGRSVRVAITDRVDVVPDRTAVASQPSGSSRAGATDRKGSNNS
ncbi:NAD+ kinase [Halorubrum alkaliphilum]|uniref:NAD+ kinase n=1 Tax=Halorubrum alkaliphilum TaxID=261290 RepID=A0A8T4GG07_9EURY|nr:NAD(+)/NADH kinase [Halorubrum alkaliphilum]MBP1923073.1 NAD+ kinase [Halorubrum alkaliphilum]